MKLWGKEKTVPAPAEAKPTEAPPVKEPRKTPRKTVKTRWKETKINDVAREALLLSAARKQEIIQAEEQRHVQLLDKVLVDAGIEPTDMIRNSVTLDARGEEGFLLRWEEPIEEEE